jgi:hypothetical protein
MVNELLPRHLIPGTLDCLQPLLFIDLEQPKKEEGEYPKFPIDYEEALRRKRQQEAHQEERKRLGKWLEDLEVESYKEILNQKTELFIDDCSCTGSGVVMSKMVGYIEKDTGHVRFDDLANPKFYLEVTIPLKQINELRSRPISSDLVLDVEGSVRHIKHQGSFTATIDALTKRVWCHDATFRNFYLMFYIPDSLIKPLPERES